MKNNLKRHEGYDAGHPWYYVLGGDILRPKQILESVRLSTYQGYLAEDIKQADAKSEPQRSAQLRKFKIRFKGELARDLPRYRAVARDLRKRRMCPELDAGKASCDDEHVNISLVHNHLYNDFAHLVYLEKLDAKQPDLFGF